MLIVDVTLHSAITGQKTKIASMVIYNDGTSDDPRIGNYVAEAGRKGVELAAAIHRKPLRKAEVKGHRRLGLPVWTLVAKALKALRY